MYGKKGAGFDDCLAEDDLDASTAAGEARTNVQEQRPNSRGADADITVFDPNRVIDKATFEEPLQYSDGIQFVFVNELP